MSNFWGVGMFFQNFSSLETISTSPQLDQYRSRTQAWLRSNCAKDGVTWQANLVSNSHVSIYLSCTKLIYPTFGGKRNINHFWGKEKKHQQKKRLASRKAHVFFTSPCLDKHVYPPPAVRWYQLLTFAALPIDAPFWPEPIWATKQRHGLRFHDIPVRWTGILISWYSIL